MKLFDCRANCGRGRTEEQRNLECEFDSSPVQNLMRNCLKNSNFLCDELDDSLEFSNDFCEFYFDERDFDDEDEENFEPEVDQQNCERESARIAENENFPAQQNEIEIEDEDQAVESARVEEFPCFSH